jgi:hypothetical protein
LAVMIGGCKTSEQFSTAGTPEHATRELFPFS